MSMTRMKLPGKHRNNTTKSNRKERERPEKEPMEDERALINKTKKYLINRREHEYFSSRYVGADDLQEEFNISECHARKILNRLEKMEFIRIASWRGRKNQKMPNRYEIIYEIKDEIPNNVLKKKFGDSYIKVNGLPGPSRYKEKGEYIHNNMLQNTFNREKDLISGYKGWAESWSNIPTVKKPIIFKNYIMRSDIIACHFLHVCKTLAPKERQKIVTKIKENSDAALWAYFNCKIQNSEKIALLNSILKISKYSDLMMNILTSKHEREMTLNTIISECDMQDIYTRLVRLRDDIIDSDKIIIARALQKFDDAKLAVKVNDIIKFSDDEKDYFAHLVVAYKMAQEWDV